MNMWTLIVVTQMGVVSASTYGTEQLCRDAESVARYGMTVAEKIDSDRAAKERYEKDVANWKATHPPRPPKTENEKAWVASILEQRKKNNSTLALDAKGRSSSGTLAIGSVSTGGWVAGPSEVTDDGLIIDAPPMGRITSYYSNDPHAIKFTKCLGPDGATFQVVP